MSKLDRISRLNEKKKVEKSISSLNPDSILSRVPKKKEYIEDQYKSLRIRREIYDMMDTIAEREKIRYTGSLISEILKEYAMNYQQKIGKKIFKDLPLK